MSTLITEHCTVLEQLKENYEFYQNRDDILHDFYTELTRLQSSDAITFRQEINKVTAILCTNILNLNELILQYFLDYFIQLLKKWSELTYFDDSNEVETFDSISIIFQRHTHRCSNELLVKEISQCLLTIARIGKSMITCQSITAITRVLKVCTGIWNSSGHAFMPVTPLDDSAIKCLCAPYTIEVFAQFNLSVKSDERTPAEDFVLNGLHYHVSWMNRDATQERANELREHLLPSISDLLDTYTTSYKEWSQSSINIITTLTTSFLYSVQLTIVNDIHIDVQQHICDSAIRILFHTETPSMKLKNNCLQYVYMGTSNDKILDHLKSQQLTATMFKILNMYKNEAEIQFNVYRILAAIMTEEDIKRLDDPGAIAKVFLDHLTEIKDLLGWETRIKNLLTSLKILLQHDQIRDELYEQDGLPLFIYCATLPRYDKIIHQRALENLLIMSFHEKVNKNLKEDTDLMAQVKSMSEDSTEPDVQRAAEGLLWMLTKDETSKDSVDDKSSEHTYDIMISYSHKDKDLCFRLYDRLQKDKFRVWLDRDQMHGTPLEAMSNAIEKSEFVFVCMSDSYKQSGYCKMEAYYALERQCCIIPLIMKAQYRPDGWLGIIVTGRMRIDLPKYGFEDAYDKLMVEIDRNRKEKAKSTIMPYHDSPSALKLAHDLPSMFKPSHETPVQADKKRPKVTYEAKQDHHLPLNIEEWNKDDVHQFFIKQNLTCFLPICERMNGALLLQLYQMCATNSPVMFQSLNNQLAIVESDSKPSTIQTMEYLQFLNDLKIFVPITIEKTETPGGRSAFCVIL
ncbi:unnamed protein product [Rotaria socialis]|uniref:TIR domain-containing protein n=2 Tax=Rotaria socialis TaxID=392032 RepID=A0A818X2N8_9BILA|nr:unnamed protein product [Rotaria socialis]